MERGFKGKEGGTVEVMETFKELKVLKAKADRINRQVDKVFHTLRQNCSWLYEVPDSRGEWLKCTHKDYMYSKWTDITPCGKERCPRLE